MNARRRIWLGAIAVSFLFAETAAHAANLVPAGDTKRGAVVAATCQSCHGSKGEGMAAAGFPRLAGQTSAYLDKQLHDFASGTRANPIMGPLSKNLSDLQKADVAAYYQGLSPPFAAPIKPADAKQVARGHLLSRYGDESKQLQACANCHGPEGSGEAFAAPYLAGQSATYITSAIGEWKAGTRKNDGGQLMTVVAGRLDDADIAAVGAYFESLGASY